MVFRNSLLVSHGVIIISVLKTHKMGTRKNLIVPGFVLVLLVSTLLSCKNQEQVSLSQPSGIPATVIDYRELDGCEFLIQLRDGTKLQPVNLDNKFKKDKLEVLITWKKYDGAGICMAGTMVEITFISVAKDN